MEGIYEERVQLGYLIPIAMLVPEHSVAERRAYERPHHREPNTSPAAVRLYHMAPDYTSRSALGRYTDTWEIEQIEHKRAEMRGERCESM